MAVPQALAGRGSCKPALPPLFVPTSEVPTLEETRQAEDTFHRAQFELDVRPSRQPSAPSGTPMKFAATLSSCHHILSPQRRLPRRIMAVT